MFSLGWFIEEWKHLLKFSLFISDEEPVTKVPQKNAKKAKVAPPPDEESDDESGKTITGVQTHEY